MYRYGLALQELAGRLGSQPADQLSLLHQAAEVYLEASRLTGDRHAAVLCEWSGGCVVVHLMRGSAALCNTCCWYTCAWRRTGRVEFWPLG